MVIIKLLHEFGHAFACKRFGLTSGTGGEVHTMGVMFLVFMPMPYVDVSSASSLRSKWQRTVVGAAGMIVELAVAAVAAMVWSQTAPGTAVHAVCYNMMFVASLTTLLFNGNPLLRYDGYYILSDLTEIPNLAQRSKDYLYYLVKRYAWTVKGARNPANSAGERVWFVFYGLASTAYRVYISVRIMLFIADKFFFVGAMMAVGAVFVWVVLPMGKYVHYLATSGELMRTRQRAVVMSVALAVAAVVGVGLVPFPDRFRVEGVAEPVHMAVVYVRTDGFVRQYLPSGTRVQPDGLPLLVGANRELEARLASLLAERDRLSAHKMMVQRQDPAVAVAADRQLQANQGQIDDARKQLDELTVRPPLAGVWVSRDVERLAGAWVKRGQAVGLVVDEDQMIVRATAGQNAAASLIEQAWHGTGPVKVRLRVQGRPDLETTGAIQEIWPAGRQTLPSPALGLMAGGSVATVQDDREGVKSAERFFEIRVAPEPIVVDGRTVPLMAGQRVAARFELSPKPLIAQWYRSLLQLVQRRFHV
jgi:putative peptide zinc metalloprotease protein